MRVAAMNQAAAAAATIAPTRRSPRTAMTTPITMKARATSSLQAMASTAATANHFHRLARAAQ